MTLSISALFSIIDQAKVIGSYPIADLAFASLLDAALDNEDALHLVWENRDEDSSYSNDHLIVTNGSRSACIPTYLLQKPEVWRSLCSEEIDNIYSVTIDAASTDIKNKLNELRTQILDHPAAQQSGSKYLAKRECQVCPYFASGHTAGALYCAVHPFGYPSDVCVDWELSLGLDEALLKQSDIAAVIEDRRSEIAIQGKENSQKLARSQYWDRQILGEQPLSDRLQWLLSRWGDRHEWKKDLSGAAYYAYSAKGAFKDLLFIYDYPNIKPEGEKSRFNVDDSNSGVLMPDTDDLKIIEAFMRAKIFEQKARINWEDDEKVEDFARKFLKSF